MKKIELITYAIIFIASYTLLFIPKQRVKDFFSLRGFDNYNF